MEKKIYDEYISIRQHSIIVSPHNASEMIYILHFNENPEENK